MNYQGKRWRTIWRNPDDTVGVIDQRLLPHQFQTLALRTMEECAEAIRNMTVRGAPLIGATAAYGMCLAIRDDPTHPAIHAAVKRLLATRPTAVNLQWALNEVRHAVWQLPLEKRLDRAWHRAAELCDDDVEINEAIGHHGLKIFREVLAKKPYGSRLNVLTHCNAGWLACVDWGTALAPIFMAHGQADIDIHVWVDETRPRNQGASLTAWELKQHGVPHTVIVDNAGGHLMQHGLVDLCIVGTDRTTARGDVCNKIGTYLKALAARDNGIPFYVALPSSSIDWALQDGLVEIPIEERNGSEVTHLRGRTAGGAIAEIQITPDGSPASNYGFDVTPARLITAFITERGVCSASEPGLKELFKK
ncbi:MAG TPA: S-methyl-5-thioribose-1-phosphate isomerase [Candidatus Methylacidiphilales bacterium]|nr:S-methyl-5-thioribose-1-phosphate isomerase [Candidatus Methylacidiphilales bacterium]